MPIFIGISNVAVGNVCIKRQLLIVISELGLFAGFYSELAHGSLAVFIDSNT